MLSFSRHTATPVLLTIPALLLAFAPAAEAIAVYGLTDTNSLIRFDSSTPGTSTSIGPITGLAAGESLRGIDINAVDSQIYGLGANRLYRIDKTTGAATQVGSDGQFALNGTSFGTDFNPVPNRFRVTSDANQNLRLNQLNGNLAGTDGDLAYDAMDVNAGTDPNVTGSAYINSIAGALSTRLYAIDTDLGILAIQNPPNAGTLNTVGSLGLSGLDGFTGFDISGFSGEAFAALSFGGGESSFYRINLATGAASLVGDFGGTQLTGIAIESVPEPGTFALLGLGAAGLLAYRRRFASR